MKICLKTLSGIIVLMIFSMSLKATVLAEGANELQPILLQHEAAEAEFKSSIEAVNQNNLSLARDLIEKALRFNQSNLEYLEIASDIAFIEKRYARAEEYQVMMLLITQSRLGIDNLQVAAILDQLAAINVVQGRYKQAKFRLQESLRQREEILGRNHLLIISSLNKLASLATRQKQPAVAEYLLKRSLDVAQKVSGLRHGNSALLLAGLADFYQKEGRLGEAEVLYKEAISIWEDSSSDIPDRMISQNALGKLLLGQQRFDDAREQFKQVLLLLKKNYQDDHPYVQQAIKNIKALDAEYQRNKEKTLMYNELVRLFGSNLQN